MSVQIIYFQNFCFRDPIHQQLLRHILIDQLNSFMNQEMN